MKFLRFIFSMAILVSLCPAAHAQSPLEQAGTLFQGVAG